jgi:hypothetical protein
MSLPPRPASRSSTPRSAATATRLLFACLACLPLWLSTGLASAEPLRGVALKRDITRELQLGGESVSRRNVIVWAQSRRLDATRLQEFADLADVGVANVRRYLGETLDAPGPDDAPVHIFISDRVRLASVTIDPLPHIFIHTDSVLSGRAPYLHEIVHALAQWSWRRSEWMAEGFANHAAAEVARRYGGFHATGPEPRGLEALAVHLNSEQGREVMPLIGLWGRRGDYAPAQRALFEKVLTQRRRYAGPYYTLAWSYVDFLMAELGLAGLHRVATAADPDIEAQRLTGRTLAQLKADWLAGLESR